MMYYERSKAMKDDRSNLSVTLLSVSAGLFALGFAVGFRRIVRSEKFLFSVKDHHTPAMVATKALGLGTLLCFGTIGSAVSLVSYTSGINTLHEFGRFAKKITEPIRLEPLPESEDDIDPETKKEINEVVDAVSRQFGIDLAEIDEKEAKRAEKKNKPTV